MPSTFFCPSTTTRIHTARTVFKSTTTPRAAGWAGAAGSWAAAVGVSPRAVETWVLVTGSVRAGGGVCFRQRVDRRPNATTAMMAAMPSGRKLNRGRGDIGGPIGAATSPDPSEVGGTATAEGGGSGECGGGVINSD